jgi:SAM-dependent methyltransferase
VEKKEYKKHYELEEDYWWFAGKREIIKSVLNLIKRQKEGFNILDVGCGTGINLIFLQKFGKSYGCDLSKEALFFCKKRGLESVVRANAEKLPFKRSSFDLASLLDVLYHKNVRSDVKVLKSIHQVMKSEAYLIITDSAFNFLFSKHDLAIHTRERYRKKILKRRLEEAKFSVLRMSYCNFFLFLPVVLVRLFQRITLRKGAKIESNLEPVNAVFNRVLFSLLKIEARLLKHINLPFGSTILCLARKNSSLR